jgi:hypothetical protein
MRPEADLDIECFHNWFLVGITDKITGMEWDFQMVSGTKLDIASITALLQHYTAVTFNGTNYDMPMLMLALKGADCATLKAANDDIICNGLKWWQFYKKYDCYPPDWIDHIDISEVAPGVRVSLKQYMCRMSSKLVQDTPVDFNAPLPLEHAPAEIHYCRNDRKGTRELREVCDERMKVRVRMSERYGVDLRSKSDAQMAEAMVKAEWTRVMADSLNRYHANPPTGIFPMDDYPHIGVRNYDVDYRGNPRPTVPHFNHGTTFKARIPDYIEFATPYMQSFLETVRNCDFIISDKEEAVELGYDPAGLRTGVLIPDELKGRDITIGRSVYRVGIGGLHSQESSASHRTVPGVCTLRTADVASYYPSLILNAGMYPKQLGKLFLTIYEQFYRERLNAKRDLKSHPKDSSAYAELKAIESGFKIVLNGTFGKLFSRFSIFYAPEFGIAVTIAGQLSLLMLIERLELVGVRVVSANTDGVELSIPFGREHLADAIIAWWQQRTGLVLETKNYLALYSRDVNNYVSLQFDGSVKRKGVFGESGVLNNKHPDCDICADAVVAFLTAGTPLMTTITACSDIRKFVRVRGAKGGAVWFCPDSEDDFIREQDGKKVLQGGVHLGRAVRWYYARESNDYIVDAKSLNKVAGSDGARPVMELPDALPTDIDYAWYIARAEEMLTEIGYGRENQ